MKLDVYFHIACLQEWEPIVWEQLRLLKHVGITHVNACILRCPEDYLVPEQMASSLGISLNVIEDSDCFTYLEAITLHEVWKNAIQFPDHATLYIHAKGVTIPNCGNREHWRRIMMRYVVGDWKTNLKHLENAADLVGVSWRPEPIFPHFTGNIWMARNDWINKLQNIWDYRQSQRSDFIWTNHELWRNRHFCETWIGSGLHSSHIKRKKILCLVDANIALWTAAAYKIPIDLDGFEWDVSYDRKEPVVKRSFPNEPLLVTRRRIL